MATTTINQSAANYVLGSQGFVDIQLTNTAEYDMDTPVLRLEWEPVGRASGGGLSGGQIGVFLDNWTVAQGFMHLADVDSSPKGVVTFTTGTASVTGGAGGVNDVVAGRYRAQISITDTTNFDLRDNTAGADFRIRIVPRDGSRLRITGCELSFTSV